jgi:hypothetical protein
MEATKAGSGSTNGSAFLAIWSDVPRERETDYLHWLTREHVFERLSVEGFMGVRIYRLSHPEICRYFIHYRLMSAEVLTSQAYLQRLNAPTPWSQRIMPILGNFARGGGRVLAEAGGGRGGVIAAIQLDPLVDGLDRSAIENIAAMDRIVAVRLLETDLDGTGVETTEKTMRSEDGSFPGLLLIEGLDAHAVEHAARHCPRPSGGLYTEIFQL